MCLLLLFNEYCLYQFNEINSTKILPMKSALCTLLFTGICLYCFGQIPPIDVTEQTIKVGGMGEEAIYLAFADGDQIVFNFEEVNGKEMKEIEIAEYPSTSKFMDYKSKKIENKILNVNGKGIYKFR